MSTLQELKDDMAKKLFGTTLKIAHKHKLCVKCARPALEHCYSDAGRKEYGISGLCEECFDAMFAEPDEPTEDDYDDEAPY